jgi:amidase
MKQIRLNLYVKCFTWNSQLRFDKESVNNINAIMVRWGKVILINSESGREKMEVKDSLDHFGAFVSGNIVLEPSEDGPLAGKTFAVKDVFAIEGHRSGAGNPDWLNTHSPASETASSIRALLMNGAKCVGTTHTDELMFSLNGENAHYGTPVNPKARDRIPGGSSSGSAVAVASGAVDFAIGTDTAGSVRVPASYCGVYGFRPTHGVISLNGVIPLSPSFDTVGWFANDSATLQEVGVALLGGCGSEGKFSKVYFAKEAWALATPRFGGLPESWIPGLTSIGIASEWMQLTNNGLQEWLNPFRVIQGHEIWQAHGSWIETVKPKFGADVAQRFEWARTMGDRNVEPERGKQREARAQLERLLDKEALIIIPTVPGEAPLLDTPDYELQDLRSRTMELTCIAGFAGLPQVNLPLHTGNGAPIGISVIAGKNRDLDLLNWVNELVNSKVSFVDI